MTKQAALHGFFNSFGISGYDASNVPKNAQLPYLTYTPVSSAWGDGETAVTVNLWYRGDSNTAINAKAEAISQVIGLGGTMVQCDSGVIWLKRGSPFCAAVSDPDPGIRRRYINISAEFITAD